jgi:hypothetical protein
LSSYFRGKTNALILTKNGLGYILGSIKKASGHPARNEHPFFNARAQNRSIIPFFDNNIKSVLLKDEE